MQCFIFLLTHLAKNHANKAKKVALGLLATTTVMICLLQRQARRRRRLRTCWVRGWLHRTAEAGFSDTLVRQLQYEDLVEYRAMCRMDVDTFRFLLDAVTPLIRKEDTLLRQSVSPLQLLQMTLQYLASGKPDMIVCFRIFFQFSVCVVLSKFY